MAARHFVKHLTHSFTFRFPKPPHRLIHHLSKSPSHNPPCGTSASRQCCPNSIIAKHSTSSSSSLISSETPLPDPLAAPYWSVCIRCRKDVVAVLSEALLCFGASSTSVDQQETNEVNDEESFHPTEITKGVWIVPEWRSPPDNQATNIILNYGLAFGTGEHPTTKLCLFLLHDLIKGGEAFLDYGTGSGILAIAALKFGAASSVGFDVDPQAITSARQNADLNNIRPDKMQLHLIPKTTGSSCLGVTTLGDVDRQSSNHMEAITETEKYDVVIANILLNPLLDLADNIVSFAKPGAVVGLSGIISEQIPYIRERYSDLLEDMSVSEIDDWACVSGRKKNTCC